MGHSEAEYYSVIRRNKEPGLQHINNQYVEVKGSVGTTGLLSYPPPQGVGRPAEYSIVSSGLAT